MRRAVLTPQARRDLVEATRWIAEDNPQAARGLRAAVQAALARIAAFPAAGASRAERADRTIRFLVLRGFPYVLVYRADVAPPRVLRILHGARDLPELLERPSG